MNSIISEYVYYARADKLYEYYKYIFSWSTRRLLWIKDDKSLIGSLPVDIIRYIDDIILKSGPLPDLINLFNSISSPSHGIFHKGCELTLVSQTKLFIPRNMLKGTKHLTSGGKYLFSIVGHIKFTNEQLEILKKYYLKYTYTHKH
jgi:hypothetical protein